MGLLSSFKVDKKYASVTKGTTKPVVEIEHFSQWIVKLGDGLLGEANDGLVEINIPKELLISDFIDPVQAIISMTYPSIMSNYNNDTFIQHRVILTSRIQTVNEINEYILSIIPSNNNITLTSI